MQNKSDPRELLKIYISKRVEDFKAYHNGIEDKFESDINSIAKKYNFTKNTKIDDNDTRIIEIITSDEYRAVSDIFIRTHRNATVVSAYSFLEHTMSMLCKILHNFNKYPLELTDITGDGIQRSKLSLEKMAKIDFSPINSTWSNLQNFNLIRNCIVHAEGDIKNFKSNDKLKNIINNNNHLSLVNDRSIIVESDYVNFIINEIEHIINYLISNIILNNDKKSGPE